MYFQVSSAPFGYVPRSIWSGVLNQNINLLTVIKQFNASTKFPALTVIFLPHFLLNLSLLILNILMFIGWNLHYS